MLLYLGNLTLPSYNTFTESPAANYAQNVSLDGTLTVDTLNVRRSWVIGWTRLSASDYTSIRAKYDAQFSVTTFGFINFGIPALGVNVPVFITVNDRNLVFDGQWVDGFSITLQEQYAVS